jgi:tetratricopeptide (TPR) repeat protein
MKKLVLLLCFTLPGILVTAQQEELEEKLFTLPNDTARVNTLNKLATLHFNAAPEKTARYAKQALTLADSLHYLKGQADAYYNQSLIFKLKEQNSRQLELLMRSLKINEQLGDSMGIANINAEIGYAYHQQADFKAALEQYKKTLEMFKSLKHRVGVAFILRRVGNLESETKNYERALNSYHLALDIEKQINNQIGVANVLNNIGVVYNDIGQYEKALGYFDESLKIQIEMNNQNRMPAAYHNQGRAYLGLGNPDKALQVAALGLPIAKRLDNRMAIYESTTLLSDIYFEKKDYKKAYEYLREAGHIEDSIVNERNFLHYAQLKSIAEIEQREKELDFLKKESAFASFRIKIMYAAIAAILLVAFVIFYFQRRNIRNKKALLEKTHEAHDAQQALMKAELENKKLAEKQLTTDLEFRHKELLTYTLNLVQKNTILESVREAVHELMSSTDKDSQLKITKLIKTIDYSLETEKDWDEFRMYFEKVHSSFFDNLKSHYPDLTQSDLKLCALLSLNLSMKEMAELMGISPESVKMARHRLRKKLNLVTEENLTEFIATFKTA